eukprot:20786_1
MEHLQKLKIRCKGDNEILVNMKIRSKSLLSIDTSGSLFTFSIYECVCPQLQRLKCDYTMGLEEEEERIMAMFDNSFIMTNGVHPILHIGSESPFRGQRKLTLKVGQHPFHNMTASDTCKVVFKYRELQDL